MQKLTKNLTALLLLAALLAAAAFPCAAAATDLGFDLQTAANALYVVNADTGRVVCEKNADARVYPASCTKIMTAALAMSLCPDLENTVVTVPVGVWGEFEGIDISNAGLAGGEEITMYDLLHCMLLQSANEAASAVAAYFGRDSFIEQMNAKAAELGCTGTHFTNPHGLYNENHYTTARDLYRITEWALSIPGFWEIASKARYTLPATNKHDSRILVTTNKLQDSSSGYYTDYIRGIKTGTIDESGRCLVTAAVEDGVSYIAVIMGCPMEPSTAIWSQGNSVFTEARLLFDWCFDNLRLTNLVADGDPVAELPLRYAADKDYLMLYAQGDAATVLNKNAEGDPVITYESELPETLYAPVEAGQLCGAAKVYADGIYIGTVELVSHEAVEISYFVLVMDKLGAVLTSVPAMIVYALLFLAGIAYAYYMLAVVPAAARARAKRSGAAPAKNRGKRI